MHTETNFYEGPNGDEAIFWLWKEWANVLRVRNDGIPVVGFTWYSLTDQVDWDTALREYNNRQNPLGLYDLDRKIRPVGEAYKKLISDWQDVLPTQSVCLRVPVMMPSENDGRSIESDHKHINENAKKTEPTDPEEGVENVIRR